MIRVYRECELEVKNQFFCHIVKPDQSIASLSLPYNVNIFTEEVQLVCSLLSQILGLDNDQHVVEVIEEL
jgi:hypothetical protein